jgi:hypothetical protein
MQREVWEQVKDIVANVVRLPRSERAAYLRENCQDPALRAEIVSFIDDYDRISSTFLERADEVRQATDDTLERGTLIGPYIIRDRVGRGGMGQVFLAEDLRLHRLVAIKTVLGASRSLGDRHRIIAEARAAAQVNHPNVAAIYDVIEDSGRAFIVMEHVDGKPLSRMMHGEPWNVEPIVRIGSQIANAIAAAHTKGVVHRDVKPSNVMVMPDGTVKVLDFGIAATTDAFSTATDVDRVRWRRAGTPGYMSPEQWTTNVVDGRSDVFSLGLILFELATGQRAYAEADPERLRAASLLPIGPARVLNPRIPQRLSAIISSATFVDRERRPSASATHQALEAYRRRIVAAAVIRDAFSEAFASVVTRVTPARLLRNPWLWTVKVPAAAMIVVIAAGFMTSMMFDHVFERSGYSTDTLETFFVVGVRSLVPFAAYLLLFFIAATILNGVRRIALYSPHLRRADQAIRHALVARFERWNLDEPRVQGYLLSAATIVFLCAVVWSFRPLLAVLVVGASSASDDQLRFLATDSWVIYLFMVRIGLIVSTFAWYQIGRRLLRPPERRNSRLLPIAIGSWVVLFLAFALPHRTFASRPIAVVEWNRNECSLIGARPDSSLLFCPTANPRRQVAPVPPDRLQHFGAQRVFRQRQ